MASAHVEQQLKASGVAQVIVVMKQSLAYGMGAAPAGEVAASATRLQPHFAASERSQLASLARLARSLDAANQPAALTRRVGRPDPNPVRVYPNLGVMLGTCTREGLAALQADPDVSSVSGTPEISLIRPSAAKTARLDAAVTWGIDALRVPDLWATGLTGQGIRVAHLDTGVDGQHPALKRAIAEFAEFDFTGRRVSPTPAAHDSGDHGTHTAGTIAGRPVRGSQIGVAFEADLVSALVIEGGDVVARVLGGMDWAVEQRVQILSMSLGFRGWWEDFVQILAILRARNILPVIAVGNEGVATSRSPGNYLEALSVGAVDVHQQVPLFSSSQLFDRDDPLVPDLVAPGVDIISAQPGNRYQSMDGTSMATPHIAGLAALLWQAKPDAGAAAIEEALFGACSLPATIDADRGHRGMPNGAAAYTALTGLPVQPRRVVVAPGAGAVRKTRKAKATKKAVKKAVKKTAAKKVAKKVAKGRGATAKATGRVAKRRGARKRVGGR